MCYTQCMMQLTQEQVEKISHCLPVQRGNVKLSNLDVLNAILFIAEQGCSWRALPERYGPWHTVYMRMVRRARRGVLQRVFVELQEQQLARITMTAASLDSTSVKVHPDGTGAKKKTAPRPSGNPVVDGPPKFIWWPQRIGRP